MGITPEQEADKLFNDFFFIVDDQERSLSCVAQHVMLLLKHIRPDTYQNDSQITEMYGALADIPESDPAKEAAFSQAMEIEAKLRINPVYSHYKEVLAIIQKKQLELC